MFDDTTGVIKNRSLKIPKGIIRSRKSKDRQYNGQEKKDITLHRNPKIEYHERH